MVNVIILFPKAEISKSIRGFLVKNGIQVTAVCSTGAQVIQAVDDLEDGLIVCGYQYADMVYSDLREYLPDTFDMLLIVSKNHVMEMEESDFVYMGMPFKAFELVENVQYMIKNLLRKRKKRREQPKVRSEEEIAVITHAKSVLMDECEFTEEEAHRYLQKKSMDSGRSLIATAHSIIGRYTDSIL